jgi:hypothetical protein
MPRPQSNPEEAFGSDSFLDIVANMVGILIMLVLIAALRSQGGPDSESNVDEQAQMELAGLEREADGLESQIQGLARDSEELSMIADARRKERDSLLVLEAQGKQLIEQHRQKLDERAREEFDLRKKLAEHENELNKLTKELQSAVAGQASAAIKIENYPTPISHTVTGRELHFQIQGGRVTYVPLDQMVEMLKRDFERKVSRLQDVNQSTETIGPVAGYRLRYTMARIQVGGRMGAQVTQFTLLPVADLPGDTLAEIRSGANSDFRQVLTATGPRNVTVTFWVYPDSFGVYRELKKDLYSMGFAVAGRPLPEGQHIGGSPDGTKSAAQ